MTQDSKSVRRSFETARAFARSLGLTDRTEWAAWAKSAARPIDIPASPSVAYKDHGWKGWGDWLGSGKRPYRPHRASRPKAGYRPFNEARRLVRSLSLKSTTEWRRWLASGEKPDDTPFSPNTVYRASGWIDMGDWLGTGKRRGHHRPFAEARAFVRDLHLASKAEWARWAKSADRPRDIAGSPDRAYRDAGWEGWGDWLGSGTVAPQNRTYRPFMEARAFVHALGLQSSTEWKQWHKSSARPKDIPSSPRTVYRQNGWVSMGDWLGTGYIATFLQEYRQFEDARAFARLLHLKSEKEWRAWCKSGQRPANIPANPGVVYRDQGWAGMGDWLGTGTIAVTKMQFLEFEEARKYVQKIGISSLNDWRRWSKSGERPADVPSSPDYTYRDKGWRDWGDWFGTGAISNSKREFRPFAEARSFSRTLNLRGSAEWDEWTTAGNLPTDIPTHPDRTYAHDGWAGWSDWLGSTIYWNRQSIVSFLKSLIPVLPSLDPAELYAIIRQNGLLGAAAPKRQNVNRELLADIVKLTSSPDTDALAQRMADQLERADGLRESDDIAAPLDEIDITDTTVVPHDEDDSGLPRLAVGGILRAVDAISMLCPSADEEAVEFFIAKAIGKLWRNTLSDEDLLDRSTLESYQAGEYGQIVRDRFLTQLSAAESLPLPAGYGFRKHGVVQLPNLMQRLIAARLQQERRLGNWSGTGAGKTLAAVLASRTLDAQLTVIVGLNNTLEGWKTEILNAFPDSVVLIKESGQVSVPAHCHAYLLLNFEAFQQPDASSLVRRLTEDHRIDLVVLDEIHSVKQRNAVASKRRQVLGGMLTLAATRNPHLSVLGMSATPVVNNLVEAVSLLEMVRGVRFEELDTRPTIPNVIAIHEKLVVHGVRYLPRYQQQLELHCVEVSGDHLADQLCDVGKGDVLGIERVLLETKMDTIIELSRPGTLVYTHYVEGIVPTLHKALAGAGLRVAEFTGTDKSGLERFKRGEVDVLIGSSTLGTGVDGLQEVCNRLVIATLPWTHAGYEQLVGRIYRQGSHFQRIDVYIPQVVLSVGENPWSWDVQRRDRILYKRTLADAAVDGAIPEGVLESEQAMLGRSLEALRAWIGRLEQGEPLRAIVRDELRIPLPEDARRRAFHRFGDFATMNARFNNARSQTTHTRLSADPSEWFLYHTLYREARSNWPETPNDRFVQWLRARPHFVVGDFGCGEAMLSQSISNMVVSIDHVAVNDKVRACDMADTGLEAASLDVVVFSLSLMGSNIEDYFREAYRVLKVPGLLKIAEPAHHWDGPKRERLFTMISQQGFQVIGSVEERSSFLYIDALKV